MVNRAVLESNFFRKLEPVPILFGLMLSFRFFIITENSPKNSRSSQITIFLSTWNPCRECKGVFTFRICCFSLENSSRA